MSVTSTATTRLAYLDNLKVGLVAWIIAGHALLSYTGLGFGWPYADLREATFSRGFEALAAVLLGPSGLVVIGAFFFVSGLLTPKSLAHKGIRRFVHDRLWRLGIPVAAFALLIWPLSLSLAGLAAGQYRSYWWWLVHGDPPLDPGPLWFAMVLLLVSLGYAAWCALFPLPDKANPVTGRAVVAAGAGIVAVSFLLRLWFPISSTQIGGLHVWQWPQCFGMFALGTLTGRAGWLWQVPRRVEKGCAATLLGAVVLIPAAALITGVHDLASDVRPFLGGWSLAALATAVRAYADRRRPRVG